jgi:2-methylisocitrate lyase-like PEP mutase family enzyme
MTTFRQLHERGLLLLPNAWDAGSARLVESLGAKAIATTSAGVAWAAGYNDGNRLPVAKLIAVVEAIARVVRVPITVDVEAGYADDPSAVAATVARVVAAGAVGINIEDGEGPPDLLAAKIAAVKRAARRSGVDLFINARTDVYLAGLAPKEARVEETLARAARYRDAGADGLFVPCITEPAEIEAVVKAVPMPLNVMWMPGLPSRAELEQLGVRRLSAGAAIPAIVLGTVAASTAAFLQDGTLDADRAMPYADIAALFA